MRKQFVNITINILPKLTPPLLYKWFNVELYVPYLVSKWWCHDQQWSHRDHTWQCWWSTMVSSWPYLTINADDQQSLYHKQTKVKPLPCDQDLLVIWSWTLDIWWYFFSILLDIYLCSTFKCHAHSTHPKPQIIFC